MARWIKRGASAEAKADADRKAREIVECALMDIEKRGDEAVREMSIKFDNWDREDYRLSQAEIDECVESSDAARAQRYRVRANPSEKLRSDSTRQYEGC